MEKSICIIGILLLSVVASLPILAAPKNNNSEGTEFWICFQKNYRDRELDQNGRRSDPLYLDIFITSNQNSVVKVDIEDLDYHQTLNVRAGTVSNLHIDSSAQIVSSGKKEKKSIHITSDNPIAVYGLNHRHESTDSYLALPVSVLGTEYRVMTYEKLSDDLLSQVAIIATEDSTRVTIIPSSPVSGNKASGVPFTFDLQKGEVYQCLANANSIKSDLTGSLITSNKKIAVFSGHSCACVPNVFTDACNHLVEQIPPLASWGKHFYLGTFKDRTRSTIRVLASEPNTKVFTNSNLVATLNAGEYYQNDNVRSCIQVTADKPVLVAQFAQGFKNGGDLIGDPMMILISPTQQFLNHYRIITPISGEWKHYVILVVPREAVASMKLNSQPINPIHFRPFLNTRYMIANLDVVYGTYDIQGSQPFGLYSYGFGFGNDAYDAYGNMGGQSFAELKEEKDSLAPLGEGIPMVGAMRVIIRDDREFDKGLKKIMVLNAENTETILPQIVGGTPQTEFTIKPKNREMYGKALIQVMDVADNVALFTVCYSMTGGVLTFSLSNGDIVACQPAGPGGAWYYGAFLAYTENFHSAEFSSAGNIISRGVFGKASGGGGIGGVLIGTRLAGAIGVSARLSFDTFGGVLTAPDSVTAHIVTDDGRLQTFQESRTLDLKNIYLSLTATGEYYFSRNYYGFVGLKASLALSKTVLVQQVILRPENYTYSNNSRELVLLEGSVSKLSSFIPGALLGGGVVYPVWHQVSVFGELMYTMHFGNLITDGNWSLSQIGLHLGARVQL